MSITVKAEVVGAERVSALLRGAGDKAVAGVRRTVQTLGLELLRKVSQDFLTGQSLRVQTGRLRRSVNERTEESGTEITSSVGTSVVYGRAWELGFSGSEQVRAHTRRLAKSGVIAQVRAHARNVTMRPRPFLAPALEQMRPRVREALQAAMSEVARGV